MRKATMYDFIRFAFTYRIKWTDLFTEDLTHCTWGTEDFDETISYYWRCYKVSYKKTIKNLKRMRKQGENNIT